MCSALYSLMALGLRSMTALYSCGMPVDSLQLTALGTQISLSGNEWQRHSILTCAEALCILGVYCLRRGYLKSQKKVLVCFQYSCLGDGGNWAAVCLAQYIGGLFCCGVAQGWTKAVNLSYKEHHLTLPVPIQTLIWWLESQGVISRTCPSFKIPTLGAK